MICLRKAVEKYLTMCRSLGFNLLNMGHNLHDFVSFMEQGRSQLSVSTFSSMLGTATSRRSAALWAISFPLHTSCRPVKKPFDMQVHIRYYVSD